MAKAKHIPLRSCAACGQKRPKADLLRIVRTPEGRVNVDLVGKEKGRGGYLCPSQECWSLGLTKNRLDCVLRAPLGEQDRTALQAYSQGRFQPASTGDVR